MTKTISTARLADIELPDFGMPLTEPMVPPSVFADRMERLQARMAARRYDHLVVWGDREHSANLAYLTGFDPRFEEAVLIVGTSGDPALLVGNECYGVAGAAPLPMRLVRFQDFSLPGQPRDASAALSEILASEGITTGSPGRHRRLEDVRAAGDDRAPVLPRRRAPAGHRHTWSGRERHRPVHRRRRRVARHQRGRAAGSVRVGGMPDLARRPQRRQRTGAGDVRARGGPVARVERRAPVVPPHAHGGTAGEVRAC